MVSPLLGYYGTWILQRINQYLRVTMIERAEHLSLRYHSHARAGDAIYRVYQDSAMITNVVHRMVLDPIMATGFLIFSLFVVCLFSPALGVLYIVGIVPIVWLVVWFTPRLQWRSRVARAANSDLTSRIQENSKNKPQVLEAVDVRFSRRDGRKPVQCDLVLNTAMMS